MTPSEVLLAAADRLRDLAAKADDGPWTVVESDHTTHIEYGEIGDDDGFPPVVGRTTEALGAYLSTASGKEIGRGCGCCMEGWIPPSDARWIAALSPDVSPALERWLRETSRHARAFGERADGWVVAPALEFAEAILGVGEEQQ